MDGTKKLLRRSYHFVIFLMILMILPGTSLLSQTYPAAKKAEDLSAEPIWIFDSDLDVKHAETADLNSDGVKDVIAAEYSTTYYGDISYVYALEGATGDTLWSYQVDDGIRSMAVGDINNDNIVDVVAGAAYNSSNTPDGRIHAINGVDGSQLWTFYVGATTSAVTIADLNGDQYPDVAAGCFDDYVYGVNGETGAQLWKHLVSSMWINAVAAGDVNGDNIDDIGFAHEYLAGWDNHFGILDGTDGTVIWDSTVTYIVFDVLIDDIDNDGQLEAAFGGVYSDDHGEIFVRSASDGSLEWGYNLGGVNHSNGNILLRSHDIDEDGDLDLFVGTYLGAHRIVAFDGDSNVPIWISDSLESNTRDLAFGDVTGDKDINVVTAGSGRIEVLEGTDGTKTWYYSVAGSMYGVSCADFDNDEILDVAAGGGADHSGSNPGKTVWALRTIESPVLWEFAFGEYGNALAVAELNGDDKDDAVAVCSVDDQAIAVDGGTGTEMWRWTGTENLYAVTTGDFDNNGQMDVAVAGYDERVTALYGDSGNILWQFDTPTAQIYRKCLQAADLNDNGDFEVIAGSDDSHVYAIKSDSKSELWSCNVGASVNDIELAQMNATGPLDVVVAVGSGTGGEKVTVIDGSDGGILWEYSAPEAVEHVEVFDANEDDIPDVAAAITPFAPKSIIMIDGSTHTEIWSQPMEVASNVHSLAHGDLDYDKIPELIVPGNSTDRKVHALSGFDGSELWSFTTGGEVNCVLVEDVDLDEQMDIVAGSDDQNVYVINGLTGESFWSYSCADDVMDIKVGDISGDSKPNIACVTFGSNGIIYAFKSLATGPVYVCGDADGSGAINILDVTSLINYLYKDGPAPDPIESGDANGSGSINILDVNYLINYLYKEGPEPVCP